MTDPKVPPQANASASEALPDEAGKELIAMEAVRDIQRRIWAMCENHTGPRMTIPPQPDDDDVAIAAHLKTIEDTFAAQAEKIAALEDVIHEREKELRAVGENRAHLERLSVGLMSKNELLEAESKRLREALSEVIPLIASSGWAFTSEGEAWLKNTKAALAQEDNNGV